MKRIPALDSIRGLLLVIMTVNHLIWISGGNSVIQLFSLQPLGQFGAAEGFILVSGFLAGAIYSRPKLSNLEIREKAWSRVASIYRYHLLCLVIVFAWFTYCLVYLSDLASVLEPNLGSFAESPWSSILLSVFLINKPSYLEILPLYIMYMALLPFVIAAYRRGWTVWVLLVSASIWAASAYVSEAILISLLPDVTLQTGYFDPFAWQLLFVGASAVGFASHQPAFNWYSKPATILVGSLALLILAAHHGAFLSLGIHQGVLYGLADKPELGWLRLLNITLWAYLIAWLLSLDRRG
ncbi:OpgC protein [Vibrio ponticus]|nr:OpgC protein [Vibrio ponticus]